LRLGLAGDALHERATGETVTDACADGAAAECEAAADKAARSFDSLDERVSHFSSIHCAS
jgi:hypothetical protein